MKVYQVSAVVIAKDEEKEIDECLKSIEKASPAEIIVVVDHRTNDNTQELALRHTEKVFFVEGRRGRLRNYGWLQSSQDIICYIDADMRPQTNYFKELIKYFKESDVASVGGALLPFGDALSGYLEWILWDNAGDFGAGGAFFRKSALQDVNGFNDELETGEDADISRRLKERGWKRVLVKDPRIYHRFAQSWSIMIHKWRHGGSKPCLKNIILFLAFPIRAPIIALKYRCWHMLWFYPLRWFIIAFFSGKRNYDPKVKGNS